MTTKEQVEQAISSLKWLINGMKEEDLKHNTFEFAYFMYISNAISILEDRQVAVYDQDTNPNLRTQFEECVKEVFGDVDKFLDLIDSGGTYEKFDVVTGSNRPDDEYYVIDRKTGEYINWYKYTHIGRSIHMNFNPEKMKDFLTIFI